MPAATLTTQALAGPPCEFCGKPTAGRQTTRCPECAEALLYAIERRIKVIIGGKK